jgi:thiamine-monophosphate kinase
MPGVTKMFSDEPTRVSQIMTEFLGGQSGALTAMADGQKARLIIGADDKDDCAAYDLDGPVTLVIGSDYVRGPKFALYEMGLLSNFDIGYYLVAANVSDIAAMGAIPIGVLTVVRYPNDLDDEEFKLIMAGIHQASIDFGTHNVGGDIGQAERIILSGTAIGLAEKGKVLTRSGASAGDLLCVTGPCGMLGAAVAYFPKKESRGWKLPSDTEHELVDSWKRPKARVAAGRILSSKPFATACQDTSDGLKATIQQLATASNVGFDVMADSVPVESPVTDVARLMGVDPLALAMSASADFQLCFTINPDVLDACQHEFAAAGLEFNVIGKATSDSQRNRLIASDGHNSELPGVAWKHQKTDISDLVIDAKRS